MCGILAIATARGTPLGITNEDAIQCRDALAHRGPDAAGIRFTNDRSVCLAHRRLAILDTDHRADQPMALAAHRPDAPLVPPSHQHASDQPALTIVYNGEWYNEPTARRALERARIPFQTTCDTETLLRAWADRADRVLDNFRGMYALAIHDATQNTLTIARDPLAIKPLYFARNTRNGVPFIIAASEPTAILRHPAINPEPDHATISAYISHSRPTLNERTIFKSIRLLPPGTILTFDLNTPDLRIRAERTINPASPRVMPMTREQAPHAIARALRSSVKRHLRADVSVCALLSGGIDSTAITTIAARHKPDLQTFAAGPLPGASDPAHPDLPPADDLAAAATIADHLNLTHHAAHLTRESWHTGWSTMINDLGVPMSTPNEVAIHAVARSLRESACTVALTGEGADELLLGYLGPLAHLHNATADPNHDPADTAMNLATWLPTHTKHAFLNPDFWSVAGHDEPRREAALATLNDPLLDSWFPREPGDDTPHHAAFARQAAALARTNLANLLRRLDSATMLASVEGRTPFADLPLARIALAAATTTHFDATNTSDPPTKLALRQALRAIEPQTPSWVFHRPKASFPLPFERWLTHPDTIALVTTSPYLPHVYKPAAIALAAADPTNHWALFWPMANLAAWARRWNIA